MESASAFLFVHHLIRWDDERERERRGELESPNLSDVTFPLWRNMMPRESELQRGNQGTWKEPARDEESTEYDALAGENWT